MGDTISYYPTNRDTADGFESVVIESKCVSGEVSTRVIAVCEDRAEANLIAEALGLMLDMKGLARNHCRTLGFSRSNAV